MSDVPAVRVTNNPITSWGNKVGKAIAGNSLAHSPDFLLNKSARGVSLRLNPKHKYPLGILQYTGSYWDASSSYDVNTIVRVSGSLNGSVAGTYVANRPIPSMYYYAALVAGGISLSGSDFAIYVRDSGVNYIPGASASGSSSGSAWDQLQSGTGVSWKEFNKDIAFDVGTIVRVKPFKDYGISFYDTSSGGFPPLRAGTFIVVNAVPDTASRDTSGNLYYPFWPQWDDSATVTVSGSVKNQIFYRELEVLTPNMEFCDSTGTEYSGFGVFYTSGSDAYVFNLPYS